ncbi:MAG TPA: hypothetical protein VEI94_03850 [Candidatus Bathyarchaeia archaeon]|nr:hypothetical protein [Candidatus Bathyarchaeia archaeon]
MSEVVPQVVPEVVPVEAPVDGAPGPSHERSLAMLVLPCLAVVAVVTIAFWLGRAEYQKLARTFSRVEADLVPALLRWRSSRPPEGVDRGVMFGDSVLVLGCGKEGLRLEPMLAAELTSRGVPNELLSLAHGGFRATQFYYFLDDVLAGHPRLAAVEINLRSFSRDWAEQPVLRFQNLSRKLDWQRALRVRAPLAKEEVSLLDPPVYRLEERLDALDVANGINIRGRGLLTDSGHAVNRALGLRTARVNYARTLDAERAIASYENDFADHWMAAMLRELLRGLREAGVRTVLFVTPVNVDRIAELGLTERLDLPARIEDLRRAIGATPAEWRDLHAAVRAPEFRDESEHLQAGGCRQVAGVLADALVEQRGR